MILRFAVENWMSYRDRVEFSMIASRERQHRDRLSYVNKYKTWILPIAAVYGGNASGKTNLFKALNFAKGLIVKGTHAESLLPVDRFRLDVKSAENPARFSFELLIKEMIYEFSFTVDSYSVLEEKLVQISSTSEKILYDRREGKPNFDSTLNKDKFLHFAFQGTRDNQLFLTNSVSQKVDRFKSISDWFRNNLELVAPDSRFEPFEQFLDEEHPLYGTMNSMLPRLDTGIASLGGEDISFENAPIPEVIKTKLQEDVKEGMTVRVLSEPNNDRFLVRRKGEDFFVKKLVTNHRKSDGSLVKFDMNHESAGSQRIIDLLPAFLELSKKDSEKVFVIDEVDRSLHTMLTRRLLEAYLSSCSPANRAQLLFTTHDVLLMDQEFLRRDEMWVTEREDNGASTLHSFSEYKDIRYDKNLRKSYLQGRLGGIPKIFQNDIPADQPNVASDGIDD